MDDRHRGRLKIYVKESHPGHVRTYIRRMGGDKAQIVFDEKIKGIPETGVVKGTRRSKRGIGYPTIDKSKVLFRRLDVRD